MNDREREEGFMAMSEGDVIQRLTAVGLIAGGILILASIAISPRVEDPSSFVANLSVYADTRVLSRLSALSMAVGAWGLVIGFANVHHFIRFGAGAAWGRLGFYGLVVAGAALTVAEGLAFGAIQAAVEWAATPGDSTFGTASGLLMGSTSAFDLSVVAFWSALVVVGIAWTRTDVYPRWAGRSLLALGSTTAPLALMRLLAGTTPTLELVLMAEIGLTGLWAFVVGIWAAHKAWQPETQARSADPVPAESHHPPPHDARRREKGGADPAKHGSPLETLPPLAGKETT